MRAVRLFLAAATAALLLGAPVLAQEPEEPAAGESAAADDDSLRAALMAQDPRLARFQQEDADAAPTTSGPFFTKFTNKPKGGLKATLQSYTYYGEWETVLGMTRGSEFQNRANYSWADYRSYDKVIETRNSRANYRTGGLLPFNFNVSGNWDWSEDRSVNRDGVLNLIKRDNRTGRVNVEALDLRTATVVHDLTASVGVVDETTQNRGAVSDRNEGTANLRLQSGWEVDEGLILAGRVYGEGAEGDRRLRHRVDTAKAIGDSLGAGAYYDRGWLVGRAVLTQSNFESEFLDWRRNDRGSVDTSGISVPADQIVRERRLAKRQALVLENEFRVGRFGLAVDVGRTVSEVAYAASRQGVIEDFEEKADFELMAGVGPDSFVVSYNYYWKWDDQYLREGARRGRQNTRRVGADLRWMRTVFADTRMRVDLNQSLEQQIPDERPNGQNKDLLRTGAAMSLRRSWGDSDVDLSMRWSENQDLAIDAAQSIQNFKRNRYTISPGYTWQVRDGLRLAQDYSLYIEYRDYDYPDDDRRAGNYDKRGRLTTFFDVAPTERLRISVAHIYNKTFKADRSGVTAAGGDLYATNLVQTFSELDFGFTFTPVEDVTLEGRTKYGRDRRFNPLTESEKLEKDGEVHTGLRARKKWGGRNPVELSLKLEKVHAYGRGVQPESADYWVIDSWLKWSF